MKTATINWKRRWNELGWDELVKYHSIERREYPIEASDEQNMSPDNTSDLSGHADATELMERMQEFEIISGLTIIGVGVMPMDEGIQKEAGDMVAWLEKEIGAKGSCVWLKNGSNPEIFVVKKSEFARIVREATAWMIKKEGLLKLPEKFVVVDGETFALPTFVGNDDRVVRYGQYGDMQMYMVGIMGLMTRKEENATLETLRKYRNGFLSTLLLPTVEENMKVDDVRAKSGCRLVARRRVMKYGREGHERVAEKMDKAPAWLFSLLWHLVQSCLAYYHGRFPDLVSENKRGGKKNTDMFVAKLGTDNAVMKYAGYPSTTAVNEEPIGVILERLDAMAKENKEWEKAKRRRK